MSEGVFKQKFRTGIEKAYGNAVHAWSISDKFLAGSPDLCFSWDSKFFGVEAKYASKLPVRESSKLLKHKVSTRQRRFLTRLIETGNRGIVLIGLSDLAVIVYPHQFDADGNISLKEARRLAFECDQGIITNCWKGFFQKVLSCE